MTFEEIRQYCLSLENVTEKPHFDRTSFKAKTIFLTHLPGTSKVNVKLTPEDQDLFSLPDKTAVYPVPNKWGLQGWTILEYEQIPREFLFEIIETSYRSVFGKDRKRR